jgi:hypothetical protein
MAIPFAQQLIAVIFSVTLLTVTLQLIRKHKLREEYALVWFGVSVAIFIFSVFGGLIGRIAASFGVSYAPTLALVAGLLFAVVMLLTQTVMLSAHANRIRDLAQCVAILESRIGQLEREKATNIDRKLPSVTIHQHTAEKIETEG